MRLSTLKGLAHVDHELRVEAMRRTWVDYIVRVVSHDLHGKERVDLLTDLFAHTVKFNSIEEIKDCLDAVQDLEAFYIVHDNPHGEMGGLDENVAKRNEHDGIKVPLKH
jgi:hypothetical protein